MMEMTNERLAYQAACFSDKGKVRSENQDNFLLVNNGDACLAVIADGIGGLHNGAEASRILVQGLGLWCQQIEPRLLAADSDWQEIENSLEYCITEINKRLLTYNDKMGSTLSLLLIWHNRYLIKHAGDSRIYFLRDFGLEQLTHDHTWYEKEKEQNPDKMVVPDKRHNVLVNAIGVKEKFILDSAKGDLHNVRAILLCTDGVYNYFSADNMSRLLLKKCSVEEKAASLQLFLQNSTAADNYTAIILQREKSGYGLKHKISNIWQHF